MAIIVQKYGGSSLADTQYIKQVARRVVDTVDQGHQVVVVVSAMGKTTDQLKAMASQVAKNPARRELDMLLSSGERIAMSLMSLAISDLGHEAVSLTGSQSGIITNDSHANARIIDVRPVRVQDELEKGRVVIVAGYQGMSYKREITTLGRGGSDTTAVALAAALGAEVCEILSDVDGVYTADPRCVPDPLRLEELSYDEALALTETGAKVLNPEAVAYAARHHVRIFAAATFGDRDVGTYILRRDEPVPFGRPRAVSHRRQIYRLRFSGPADLGRQVMVLLHRHGLPLYTLEMAAQQDGRLLLKGYIPPEDAAEWPGFCEAVEPLAAHLDLDTDQGAVTLVGEGITEGLAVVTQLYDLLEQEGFSPCDLKAGAHKITAILPTKRVEEAARLLHNRFIRDKKYD